MIRRPASDLATHIYLTSRSTGRRLSSKLCDTAEEALDSVSDWQGASVAIGGFGPTGVPETLIDALVQRESAKELTVVALDVGTDHRGVGKLIRAGKCECRGV